MQSNRLNRPNRPNRPLLVSWSQASQHVYLRGRPEPMTMSRRYGARLRGRFG